jgi:hypothetical protein
MTAPPDKIISTILKHDRKVNSYKIALLRAINDVVLAFPDVGSLQNDVAVPLKLLAHYWIAYYWPFVDHSSPIWQGQRAIDPRDGQLRNDMVFRPQLTELRKAWEQVIGGRSWPADGFFLMNELRIQRKRAGYPAELLQAYKRGQRAIAGAIEMPIRYAGVGEWSVFDKPTRFRELGSDVTSVPAHGQMTSAWL